MRPASSQRAYQREDMTLRTRRPPEEYVSLLSQSESDFRSYVHSFEDSSQFEQLIKSGVISKVRLRGRMPQPKYEEFMDVQLVDFFREYGIEKREGWERDFLAPHALDRVAELAVKYGVPVGVLTRQLRYLRAVGRGNLPVARARPSDEPQYDPLDSAAGGETVDLSEIIETTRGFVERYKVSEQDFLDIILGGEATADELVERFSCSVIEATELLDAADRVYLAQGYEDSGVARTTKSGSGAAAAQLADDAVGFVQVVDGRLAVQFHNDSVYAQRYRIKQETLKELKNDPRLPADARDVLARARFINQRLSVLSRLIMTLCSQQMGYLASGEPCHLKPLAQAELARQVGEHPSTISRLIRNKSIETPWGKFPLLYLCQSKTDVVARLIAQFPKLTDYSVVIRLREEFDCNIARRTVAYHRGKRLRRNKIHVRKDAAAPPAAEPQSKKSGKVKKQA